MFLLFLLVKVSIGQLECDVCLEVGSHITPVLSPSQVGFPDATVFSNPSDPLVSFFPFSFSCRSLLFARWAHTVSKAMIQIALMGVHT